MATDLTHAEVNKLTDDPAALIQWLQNCGATATAVTCAKCGSAMRLRPVSWNRDGFLWRCSSSGYTNSLGRRVRCYGKESVRRNTFFETSRLTLAQIFLFVHYWVDYTETRKIITSIGISKQTAADWSSFCREVAIDHCITRGVPIGGPGMTVEIDESKFGRRKYHRGHAVEGQWVFGGVCRETGAFFLVEVERRDAETLIPIIQRWILPGTTVISDGWRAYNGLQDLGYRHLTVNHSANFVDPHTGAHTNRIEGQWRHAKARMPQYRRIKEHYAGYLAKFMFMTWCRRQRLNPTVEFMRAAGVLYNPNRSGGVAGGLAFAPGLATSDSDSD